MSALFSQYETKDEIADFIMNSWPTESGESFSIHEATEELASWSLLNKSFSPKSLKN